MVKDGNTEKRILDAARRVFLSKGMAGARMQEIADEAGINKSLLHYYFRSKDKLFDHILNEVIERIAMGIKGIFEKEMTVIERVNALVDVYMNVLLENPYFPIFVLTVINQNPEKFVTQLRQHVVVHMQHFMLQVMAESEKGLIRPIHPMHLLLNVLGMIIFPFAVFPLFSNVAGKEMEPFFNNFLEERKSVVKEFIVNALTPQRS
jgi:TetR/AcrR family transcriptional regulator